MFYLAEIEIRHRYGVVPVPTVFRPARTEELQKAEELVVRSINDLTERHGFGPMAILRPPDFQLFSLNPAAGREAAQVSAFLPGASSMFHHNDCF
jgi:hypothetical protein